mgnify:CR=1 FL=1
MTEKLCIIGICKACRLDLLALILNKALLRHHDTMLCTEIILYIIRHDMQVSAVLSGLNPGHRLSLILAVPPAVHL